MSSDIVKIESPDYLKEIKKIKALIKAVETDLSDTQEKIDECLAKIEEEHSFYPKKLKEIEIEVVGLRIAKQKKDILNNESGTKDEPKTEETQPKTESKECKKLYQEIAKSCHPDVTEDPELNQLFLSAQEHMESNNYSGLYNILKKIRGEDYEDFGNLDDFLKEELDMLFNVLKEKQAQQSMLQMKNSYKIMNQYNSSKLTDELEAVQTYNQLLLNAIKTLQMEKDQLEKELKISTE